MPYIKQTERDAFPDESLWPTPVDEGQLNYVITRLCLRYLGPSPRYGDFNQVIGVLECAKQELYRRMVAPYETKKIAENGDVYAS